MLCRQKRDMMYINTHKMKDEEFVTFFDKRVVETIKEFNMFPKKDKILVAASGGKDSTVLLFVLKKLGYNVEAITINAHIGCFSDESLENLKLFCTKEKIKLNEVSLRKEFGASLCYMISSMEEKGISKSSCSVCGTLRRYLLNKFAKKLKAKVILTGHNLDDEADGMFLALSMGNTKQIARLNPITTKGNFVQRAKPLYFLFEEEVERYSKIHKFNVHYGWCPCSVKGTRRFFYELNLNPEKKFNLVENVLKQIPLLRKKYENLEVKFCSVCEQPTSNDICQTCKILSIVKDISLNVDSKKEEKAQAKYACN